MVPVGASVAVDWDAVHIKDEQKTNANGAPFSCVRSQVLPAGQYRVAVRVFDDLTSAATHLGGRVVTRDFPLPSPADEVDVPLGAVPADECDASPSASAPVCTGAEARDRPCSLSEEITFAWQGGNSPTVESDSFELTPPAIYKRSRVFRDDTPDLACTAPIPRCTRDSRVITTSDIVVRVLAHPEIRAAFARGTTPVYGYDARANDGTILILYRADGASLGIGSECPTCSRPLTAAMRAVVSVLVDLGRQQTATPACSAFDPNPYF
jgi:hypothetical protein